MSVHRFLPLLVVLLTSLSTYAYDFQSGDLYYNITGKNTVEVTSQKRYYYSGLATATIPETVTHNGTTYSVTSIGGWAFSDCSSLTSITLPNSVTSIGVSAFDGCSSLTSITIPNSVTSIGEHAFYGCSSLTSVTIPTYVTSIGECAFSYCSSLTSIVVESSNTMYDSRENCNAIIETASNTLIAGCQSTTIPNSVTSIGKSAFRGCSSLSSVTIPNSVTSIGYGAFCNCSSLTDIYCYATTPPVCVEDTDYSSFVGVSKHSYIHVPAGTIPDYQLATGWRYFSNFLEISEETAISETEQ